MDDVRHLRQALGWNLEHCLDDQEVVGQIQIVDWHQVVASRSRISRFRSNEACSRA